MEQDPFGRRRATPQHKVSVPDSVGDTAAEPSDMPATDRQLYTMTIQGVGSRLSSLGIERDARTIQRWCSSGKIDAILDVANGERWLVNPASLQPVIDDIVADMERRVQAFATTSRPLSHDTPTPVAAAVDMPRKGFEEQDDTRTGDGRHVAKGETSSPDVETETAKLRRRVSELELENVQLKADVKSRESFNEYIKTQFEDVLENTLDRAEKIGRLEAENQRLLASLPKAAGQVERIRRQEPSNPHSYAPRNQHPEDERGV